MMISTRGRYALRIMLDLARHDQDGFVSLKEICDRQEVSMKYLETIVADLYRGGLVKSKRGKSGGYRLTADPENCNVYDIMRAAESNFSPVPCVAEGMGGCERSESCLTLPMWQKLDGLIEDYLSKISLKDLLDRKI